MEIRTSSDGEIQTIVAESDDGTTVSWTRVGDPIPDYRLESFVDGRNVTERIEKKRNEQS